MFEQHIFPADEPEQTIKRAATRFENDLLEIECRMLLRLQEEWQELPRVPGVALPALHPPALAALRARMHAHHPKVAVPAVDREALLSRIYRLTAPIQVRP